MKITTTILKKIIREETERAMDENEKSDYARRATDPQALMVDLGAKIAELANGAQQTASTEAERGNSALASKFQAIASELEAIIEMMQEN